MKRQYALRVKNSGELYAIVSVEQDSLYNAVPHHQEAVLWNFLDEDTNPYGLDYAPMKSVGMGWKMPEQWKSFNLSAHEYYQILGKEY